MAQVDEVLNSIYGTTEGKIFQQKFPSRINDIPHLAIFRAYKFQRLSRQEVKRNDHIAEITLPMPANLATHYNANYGEVPAGTLMENLASGVNNAPAAGKNMITGPDFSTAAKTVAGASANETVNLLGDTGKIAAGAFGVARNPHNIVMFEGIGFREHSFSYQLTPRNRTESNSITSIIKAFKYYMSPGYGISDSAAAGMKSAATAIAGKTASEAVEAFAASAASQSRAFFSYPDVFRITLMPGGSESNPHLFVIGESVLTSLQVNYHPMNYAAYVRSSNDDNMPAPVSVQLDMTFKETSIVTKETVKGVGDQYIGGR